MPSSLRFGVDHTGVSAAATLTYFFISLPGHMSAAKGFHRFLSSLLSTYSGKSNQPQNCDWLAKAVQGIANLLFIAVLLTAAALLIALRPHYYYYSAMLSAAMVLGVKLLALFVQGPETKKLSVRLTSAESQYESSLQALMVVAICLKKESLTANSISSLLSSMLVISKSGAESYLTFGGENKLENCGSGWKGFLNKLRLLATYSPVFFVTAVYRLSAAEIIFTWDDWFGVYITLPLAIGVPSLLLVLMKPYKIDDLSAMEVLEAVIGEVTTHSLWGGRGREGSKRIQLFMTIYYVSVYTVSLLFALFNCGLAISSVTGCSRSGIPIMCQAATRQPAAVACIFFGWLPGLALNIIRFDQAIKHSKKTSQKLRKLPIKFSFYFSFNCKPVLTYFSENSRLF